MTPPLRERLRDPNWWPLGDTLPMKRGEGEEAWIGYLRNTPEGVEPIVHLPAGFITYPDWETLVRDGWTPD